MSVHQIARAWVSGVPPIDRLVLLALADWSDKAGRCWPSVPQLASKTGIHERTVRLALARLETGGHLTRKSLIGKGTRYRLTLPPLEEAEAETPGAPPTPGAAPTPGGEPTPGVEPGTPGAAPTNTSATRQLKKKASPSPSPRERELPPVVGKARSIVRSSALALPALPAGASEQQWADYVEMRVAMGRADKKRAWTPTVARKAIEKLHALASAGNDPGAVLDQSVLNTWQGLFPVKDDDHGRRGQLVAPRRGGDRPSPALEMRRLALAEIEAEDRAIADQAANRGPGAALPFAGRR